MARHLRLIGIAMMGLGALMLVGYFVTPVRLAWAWFRTAPVPVQIGVGIAAIGLIILMVSLVAEKWRDDRREGDLTAD
ncbi:MAG: hypothetical protein R3178_05900 [Rhodothermales bacterium]|nr:hypothetical protein [Rhodothermales bacterium]